MFLEYPVVFSLRHDDNPDNYSYRPAIQAFQEFPISTGDVIALEGWTEDKNGKKHGYTPEHYLNLPLEYHANEDHRFISEAAHIFHEKGAEIVCVEDVEICQMLAENAGADKRKENALLLLRSFSHYNNALAANAKALISGVVNGSNIQFLIPNANVIGLYNPERGWIEPFIKVWKEITESTEKSGSYAFVYQDERFRNLLKRIAALRGFPEDYYLNSNKPQTPSDKKRPPRGLKW